MSLKKPYVSRKAKTKSADIIIIGAGISGLYTAYLLKQKYSHLSFLILESSDVVGGRIKLKNFHGKNYAVGAGIGRHNDRLLKNMLHKFQIPIHETVSTHHYAFEHSFTRNKLIHTIQKLKNGIHQNEETVFSYLQKALNENDLNEFITVAGYQDFLNDPAVEYFNTNNVEELFFDNKIFSVDWKILLKRLTDFVGKSNICLEVHVDSIDFIELNDFDKTTSFLIKAKHQNLKKQHYYSCSKVIIATTIESLNAFVNFPLYKQINGQPFLKVLGLVKKPFWKIAHEAIPSMTITNNILHKLFPMNPSKGVYMIAYNDNDAAVDLIEQTNHLSSKRKKLALYESLLMDALQIRIPLDDLYEQFWEIGTHYYEPLKTSRTFFLQQAQRPMKNMFVVGEMLSMKQGWVEGALESSHAIINEI